MSVVNLRGDSGDQSPGDIAARYTPVNWAEAWDRQSDEIDWLYQEFLERGTVNALFSKAGVGKSLLALEIAADIVRDGGTVVYIDEENRVQDHVERAQNMGHGPADLDKGLLLYSFPQLPPLDKWLGGQHLLDLALASDAGLVILDTTTRMVEGRENDSDTFHQLYRCSLSPLKARGITVLRLDHPGKDAERGQRGSSAKEDAEDTVWRLVTVTEGTEYRLEREKTRNGHGPAAFDLRRHHNPLYHEYLSPSDSAISKIIEAMDRLDIPLSCGRDRSREILSQNGVKTRNDLLSAAIRQRKTCPGQVGDSGDSTAPPDLSPQVPHVRGGQVRDSRPRNRRPASPCPGCGTADLPSGRQICQACSLAGVVAPPLPFGANEGQPISEGE